MASSLAAMSRAPSRKRHPVLKLLHQMSKIRISDEFAPSSTDFIRVATLEALKAAGMIVVRGARCPILVLHDDGRCLPSIIAALILDSRSIAARSKTAS